MLYQKKENVISPISNKDGSEDPRTQQKGQGGGNKSLLGQNSQPCLRSVEQKGRREFVCLGPWSKIPTGGN